MPRSRAMGKINRREFAAQFLQLAATLAVGRVAPAGTAASLAPGGFAVAVERDVMIPARDGVLLATDLYRPANASGPLPGRFPTLLERTPYGKSQTTLRHASIAVAEAFASQ